MARGEVLDDVDYEDVTDLDPIANRNDAVYSSPICVVSPITTPIPWSIKNALPMVAPGWISIPVKKRAMCDITRGITGTPHIHNV